MRYIPGSKYLGLPCSYVATGCAFEDYFGKPFNEDLPNGLKDSGWLSLADGNRFVRKYLPVKKKLYFKRKERFPLSEFLKTNKDNAVVCVYGHLIYVKGSDYISFFDNDDDPVVCIWLLKGKEELA